LIRVAPVNELLKYDYLEESSVSLDSPWNNIKNPDTV